MARVGIYAGAFNPVHAGHIGFALQAVEQAGLDRLYFLPERRPRFKQGVEHFGHRVAMLRRAIKPHPKFSILELPDISFSVERTLPRLQQALPGQELVFLFGSDVAARLAGWPDVEHLLGTSELIIGVHGLDTEALVKQQLESLSKQPQALHLFVSHAPKVSSRQVRNALRRREYVQGLLKSVQRYSDKNWLYVSLA
ncbi:MAG TPA: hypothetical protein VN778_01665 [Verrucomicrobiae bacterium]|nr:hypothetical protein [Verrucomicrobiae bacterium]